MNVGPVPTLPPVIQKEPKVTLTMSQWEAIHQILDLDCDKAPTPFGKRKVDMKLQAIQNDFMPTMIMKREKTEVQLAGMETVKCNF